MKSSKYKGIYYDLAGVRNCYRWQASKTFKGIKWRKDCKTEREAAIAYDKKLIELGLEPVNILKRKVA